jgi:hypothetical protein
LALQVLELYFEEHLFGHDEVHVQTDFGKDWKVAEFLAQEFQSFSPSSIVMNKHQDQSVLFQDLYVIERADFAGRNEVVIPCACSTNFRIPNKTELVIGGLQQVAQLLQIVDEAVVYPALVCISFSNMPVEEHRKKARDLDRKCKLKIPMLCNRLRFFRLGYGEGDQMNPEEMGLPRQLVIRVLSRRRL